VNKYHLSNSITQSVKRLHLLFNEHYHSIDKNGFSMYNLSSNIKGAFQLLRHEKTILCLHVSYHSESELQQR
jgi:hypothetical protein